MFNNLKVSSVAVNGDTWNEELRKVSCTYLLFHFIYLSLGT